MMPLKTKGREDKKVFVFFFKKQSVNILKKKNSYEELNMLGIRTKGENFMIKILDKMVISSRK